MNYKKIYDALVDKAKPRGLDKSQHEGYFEIHHIAPRCMGGSDDKENLVMFTAREHFIAHILLWKIYPSNSNLFHAAWMMSNRTITNRNSRVYASLREQHALILSSRSEFNSPNFKDLTGFQKGRLTVLEFAGWTNQSKGKRTSTWSCECSCGEFVVLRSRELSPSSGYVSCGCYKQEQRKAAVGEENPFFGRKHSEESKELMRKKKLGKESNRKGVALSDETKQKISETKKKNPVVWTEERRKAHSEAMKGKCTRPAGFKASEDTKKKLSQSLLALDKRAWEIKTVYDNPAALQMWYSADFYYNFWLMFDKPGIRRFVSAYNLFYNDCINEGSFNKMLLRFKSGWIPEVDEKWILLREEYEK